MSDIRYDRSKADEYKSLLTNGATFIKHCMSGKPHQRIVLMLPDGKLIWGKPNAAGDVKVDRARMIDLKTLLGVQLGKEAGDFLRKTARDSRDDHCFSVCGQERLLNLEAHSKEQRDLWAQAIVFMHDTLNTDEPTVFSTAFAVAPAVPAAAASVSAASSPSSSSSSS